MGLTIKLNQDIEKNEWGNFVSEHSDGNIFQAPIMFDFFSSVRYYRPLVMACIDGQNRIKGLLLAVVEREQDGIIGKFSSRAIAWGGPLLSHDANGDVMTCILQSFVKQLRKEAIYLEIRNLFDLGAWTKNFRDQGFIFKEHLDFHVCPARVDPWKKLGSNRKRQIKKGLSSGAIIKEAMDIEQIDEFYGILTDLYKNKVRKPLPDSSFFRNFYESKGRLGIFLLVIFNDRVIGGIMCPIFKNKVIYEWYICGLDEQYPEQFPSVLATWAAIDYAHKNGLEYFDFMGAGAPDQDYGVREFKARFGGELVNYGRFVRINNKALYQIGKIGLKMLGMLKKI